MDIVEFVKANGITIKPWQERMLRLVNDRFASKSDRRFATPSELDTELECFAESDTVLEG